jgi:hypothetical protein
MRVELAALKPVLPVMFAALLWLIPDPRIEKALKKRGPDP